MEAKEDVGRTNPILPPHTPLAKATSGEDASSYKKQKRQHNTPFPFSASFIACEESWARLRHNGNILLLAPPPHSTSHTRSIGRPAREKGEEEDEPISLNITDELRHTPCKLKHATVNGGHNAMFATSMLVYSWESCREDN